MAIYVFPEVAPRQPSDEFSVVLRGLSVQSDIERAQLQLARVDWEITAWSATFGGRIEYRTADTLRVKSRLPNIDQGVYEITQIELTGSKSPTLRLRGGRDYPRQFINVGPANYLVDPRGMISRAGEIERYREYQFQNGIDASQEGLSLGRYRGFAFVQGCSLTRRMRFHGFELVPVDTDRQPSEMLTLLAAVLKELGGRSNFSGNTTLRSAITRNNPLVVIHIPVIHATTRGEAFGALKEHCKVVLSTLAPHRLAKGRVFAFVLEDRIFAGNWLELGGRPYEGNLAGGFISGEDPVSLSRAFESVKSDPMIQLFATLHSEALAEENPDFAYFRFWNLLESIATMRIAGGLQVMDFNGAPVLNKKGNPLTTSAAGPRVHELIRSRFTAHSITDTFFNMTYPPGTDLWRCVEVWKAFRHATAHFGGFRPSDPVQQAKFHDFKVAEAAHKDIIGAGGQFGTLTDPFFSILRTTCQLLVDWEVYRRDTA